MARAPNDMCLACITPPVQVDCRAGRCVAVELVADGSGAGDYPGAFSQDHCGALEVPPGWQESPAAATASRGALAVQTVIGCGE